MPVLRVSAWCRRHSASAGVRSRHSGRRRHAHRSGHFLVAGAAEVVTVERKRTDPIRSELDPDYLARRQVGANPEIRQRKAVQAVEGNELERDRLMDPERDLGRRIPELPGRHVNDPPFGARRRVYSGEARMQKADRCPAGEKQGAGGQPVARSHGDQSVLPGTGNSTVA